MPFHSTCWLNHCCAIVPSPTVLVVPPRVVTTLLKTGSGPLPPATTPASFLREQCMGCIAACRVCGHYGSSLCLLIKVGVVTHLRDITAAVQSGFK